VKYFFDNCLSYRYVDMLRALDVDATALRSQFSESIKDFDLFQQIGGSGSVFVSCDLAQTTRLLEATALKQSGVTAIYFGPYWTKMDFWQQAIWLVSHWQSIDRFASSVVQGTFAEIKRNGKAMVFTI
jgi:hypothetical protein